MRNCIRFATGLFLLALPLRAQLDLKPPPPQKPTTFPEIVIPLGKAAGMIPLEASRLQVSASCVLEGVACVQRELGRLGISGREKVVVVGDGVDAARAFWLAEWAGVREVRVLEGTWKGEREARPAVEFVTTAREEAAADAAWVRERMGAKGTEILDVRDAGIWMETKYEAPPSWAAGHIPHALPFDFRRWLSNKEERWPEPVVPWDVLLELGPRQGTRIDPWAEFVIYGEDASDSKPALGYLLLRRMGLPARVFPAGWQGWKDQPVVRVVGPKEVRDMEGAAVIDLREPGDHKVGHVPGAVNHPAYDPLETVERFVAEHWPKAKESRQPIILYCYGRGCIRSRDAATKLARAGYRDLRWFREGMIGWLGAGLPVAEPGP